MIDSTMAKPSKTFTISNSGTTENTETTRDLEAGTGDTLYSASLKKDSALSAPKNADENNGFSNFSTIKEKDQGDGAVSENGDSDSTSSGGHNTRARTFVQRRKIAFTGLILLVGAFASAAFLSIGILNAKDDQTTEFNRVAEEFVVKLQGAFNDYELFGLWIHSACRERGRANPNGSVLGICSRQDFHELYQYILSVGLDFQSAQFMPYVPNEKREAVESEARDFYEENFDHVNYRGIVGLFYGEDGVSVSPQDEKEFYWPVHYIEPVVGNEAAIELDLYSSRAQRRNIEYSMEKWLPSVTDRLSLVQETEGTYGIILHHPGIRLNAHTETDKPTGVALMVIRIPALLARSHVDAQDSASYYIYDATHTDDDPVFLGAHTVYVQQDHVVTFNGLAEMPLEELQATVETRLEIREVAIADRTWIVAVVSLPDTYEPDITLVIVGGVIIFMASLILSSCFWTHMTKMSKLNAIRAQAAQEKAEIIVDNARKQALAERQLNEYIAHEVRNPLSSAIAALSFVSAASKQPEQTVEEKQVMQDDLRIIDASLQFINELLRNMLDMHRAANQQMKITMAPTDLRQDVLEPVASILHMRGNKVEIITECPPNIVVMSDRLRLKQIVLNLAVNSTKFVEKGFIRLKCVVQEHHDGQSVQVHLEDSGPGIPREKRGNLFAKFQESLDLLNQGTGIGLCLCKHLTNLMKGDLWLDEHYDSGIEGCPGTRFILDLHVPPMCEDSWDETHSLLTYDKANPLESNNTQTQLAIPVTSVAASSAPPPAEPGQEGTSPANSAIAQPPAEPSTAQQPPAPAVSATSHNHERHELPEKLKVLFADDDMVLRKLFGRSLKRVVPGWEVQEAANGETAVRIIEQDPSAFQVIFLDQYMSSIDKQMLGTETARALRAKGVTCRICGLSANDTEEAFLDAGADCFLFKPFPCEKEALKRALMEVLYAPSKSVRNVVAGSEEMETEETTSADGQAAAPPNVEDFA